MPYFAFIDTNAVLIRKIDRLQVNKKRAESALRTAKQKELGEDGYFDRWNTNW